MQRLETVDRHYTLLVLLILTEGPTIVINLVKIELLLRGDGEFILKRTDKANLDADPSTGGDASRACGSSCGS